MRNTKVFGVMIITALAVTSLAGQTIVWDKTWDSGFGDMVGGVALDTVNNAVYTTGTSRDGSDVATDNMVTIKYDTDGNFQWAKVFDSDTTDDAFDLAVDKSGFIYVAGQSWSQPYNRIRLIKYDTNGNEIWNILHDSDREECAYAITVPATVISEAIYVTGPSWGQVRTVKFSPDGNEVWTGVINGVTGYPFDLVVATNGSIYSAGFSMEATDDPLVVRFNSNGDTVWRKLYDLGAEEWSRGIAIDADGNLYLAGTTRIDPDSLSDILVLKLDADGNLLWNKTYDSNYDDQGNCIAADKDYIYVSGQVYNKNTYVTSLPLLCYDRQGNLLWDTLLVSGAVGKGIVSDGKYNLYISAEEGNNFGLIKVHHSTAVEEQPSSPSSEPSSVTLEIADNLSTSPVIRYSIPMEQSATLSFYSADGRLIETHPLPPSQITFTWDTRNTPSGVYFARLVSGDLSVSRKVLLTR